MKTDSCRETSRRAVLGQLGRLLSDRGLTLATAESCTGGLVAARITAIPGSSGYFAGGVVTYSNAAKQNLLSVSPAVLSRHGAVSRPVARQMARNVCRLFDAGVGIAITGIAGPGGGSPAKPVGLVFIAVARGETVLTRQYRFSGSRSEVREQAVNAALALCRRVVEAGS